VEREETRVADTGVRTPSGQALEQAATRPLPPGRMGPPLLGETPAFISSPFIFLEERSRRYGPVFRSHVVGRRVIFLSGLEGAEAFYAPGNITREDAHPMTLVDLFGGINMEMYDGPRHVGLKTMALTAFDLPAIAGYLPDMHRLIAGRLAVLAERGTFEAHRELRTMAIEAICWNVLGLAPGPKTDAITRDYGLLLPGITSVPIPLPVTTFGRARAAKDRLLATIREVIAERRANPGIDALSRMLLARTDDGRRFTDEEAMLEVHHIVVAGFIVYALMAEVLRQLAEQPDLLDRCAAEVDALPQGPLTMDGLRGLRTCTAVVLETKRVVPLVPLAFGRAARDFTCAGYRIPAGWTVYLSLHLSNADPQVFAEPDRFDPDRFGPDRAEHEQHPMAFIPQGAGPPTGHQCLGVDYATVLTLAFLAVAVRSYRWELPRQDLRYAWTRVPPEPRDGLLVRIRPIAALS
jgi:retinoid hydroxylase